MASADELYGKDVAFKSDFVRSATGDLDTIDGLSNLKEALIRRVLTQPGSIIHRPDYGVGLKNYLNGLNSISTQQKLALKIQEQVEKDERVEQFLGLRVEESEAIEGKVVLTIRVKPVGYSEQSIVIPQGGING